MTEHTNEPPSEPAWRLDQDICDVLAHTMFSGLPALAGGSRETAERMAVDLAAAARPANMEEASLVALYVTSTAQAAGLLRLAEQHAADPYLASDMTAQGARMMREALSVRRLLLNLQRDRRRREAKRRQEAIAEAAIRHALMETLERSKQPAAAPAAAQPTRKPASRPQLTLIPGSSPGGSPNGGKRRPDGQPRLTVVSSSPEAKPV